MKAIIFLLVSLATGGVVVPFAHAGGGHEHGHGAHQTDHDAEPEKGPHGGRVLKEGALSLELTIFEKGVPPQFRAFMYRNGVPIAPAGGVVTIELTRFGDKKEIFELKREGEMFTSSQTVEEPHSFDVQVRVGVDGSTATWEFSSYEGRTELSDAALAVANVEFVRAGPAEISNNIDVFGRLLSSQNRVAHFVPRFPGVVREIRKDLGERVAVGDVIAVIESNQSLQPYEIRSQIAGEVIARHATPGEFVRDDEEILVVADLSEIWADFQVYRDDFNDIKRGQTITVELGTRDPVAATVMYVAPITDEATQSRLVRAVIPNPHGMLRPGLFVTGSISSAVTKVPVAVQREAVQTFRDWKVVYLTDGHVFQAMPIELGVQDARYVQVLAGIEAGQQYVARNSFLIKADIEKSGTSHDH